MSLTGKATADKLLQGKIHGLDVIYTDTYEIAVKNGYEGTIDEWLASLKGEKGEKGDTGARGIQGEKGNTGSSIHACTGTHFIDNLVAYSSLCPGDLYLITEDHLHLGNVVKGNIYLAVDYSLYSFQMNIIGPQGDPGIGYLTDRTTGTNYTLYVDNGKLMMEVAE